MIVLCSIFRNSFNYLDRYFDQVRKLRERIDLTLVLTEGDSTDATWDMLKSRWTRGDTYLKKVDHGGPRYPSIDLPQRWEQIAQVVRPTVARALELNPDMVIWVESDLLWDAEDMMRLVDAAKQGKAVAPMVLAEGEERFYDTWGFRMNGAQFNRAAPYIPGPGLFDDGLVKIDSCGSCFVTPEPERHLRTWSGLWPFPAAGELWLEQGARIRHP